MNFYLHAQIPTLKSLLTYEFYLLDPREQNEDKFCSGIAYYSDGNPPPSPSTDLHVNWFP